jgi:hypothetical protein
VSAHHQGNGHDEPIAMLVCTVPVRLVEVSRNGCRVEIDRHLAAGTNGQLHLELEGRVHVEDVRVSRCQQRQGASRIFQVGIELLRTRRLSQRSLRLALRRFIGGGRGELPEAPAHVGLRPDVDGRQVNETLGGSRSPPPVTVDT